MAEELGDGEFWLPSQFLTDDDILNDFNKSDGFGSGSGSGSGSSSDLGSTETESCDEDDRLLLSGLPRQFSQSSLDCRVHSKGWVLSSSPQSTLCGCDCHHQGSGSSLGSPVSLPKDESKDESSNKDSDDDDDKSVKKKDKKNKDKETLDLLKRAAGEMAKMKIHSKESGRSTVGTGFFDCSNSVKGLICPPPPPHQQPPPTKPTHFPPFYSHPHFHHFSPMMWGPVQLPPPPQPQPQNRVTKPTNANTKRNTTTTTVRPLGLPPSAWPPLPGQPQAQPQPQAQAQSPQPQQQSPPPPQTQPIQMMGMFVVQPGQKGTGVFLPRRVVTTPESKKKTDGNATKTKSNKGSQRRNNRTPKSVDDDIQLPPEWVY